MVGGEKEAGMCLGREAKIVFFCPLLFWGGFFCHFLAVLTLVQVVGGEREAAWGERL